MAGMVAIIGTALIFTGAYLIEKTKGSELLRGAAHFLAMLPMAVAGAGARPWLCVFRQCEMEPAWGVLRHADGARRQFPSRISTRSRISPRSRRSSKSTANSRAFLRLAESAVLDYLSPGDSADLNACDPGYRGLPVRECAHDGVGGGPSSMAPSTKLASIAIVHMDEAGATAAAAAMATCIVFTAIGAKLAHVDLDRFVFSKLQAWRAK